ncbi:MAG: hypothetical protein Q8P56_06510, partial [Candidatus Uhrbacteria bacterium]|nr:hypothetical protein [Candidatus Uhrbacteria bacterium]
LVRYIVQRGMDAIHDTMGEQDATLDYLAIFAKDDTEYSDIERYLESLGEEVDKALGKTGRTFILNREIQTLAGPLFAIKIRKPDPTRPQRGAPDFRVKNYSELKDKFLSSSGNFTLMVRKEYEMMEIKGVDVLVYIPSKSFDERLKENIK